MQLRRVRYSSWILGIVAGLLLSVGSAKKDNMDFETVGFLGVLAVDCRRWADELRGSGVLGCQMAMHDCFAETRR